MREIKRPLPGELWGHRAMWEGYPCGVSSLLLIISCKDNLSLACYNCLAIWNEKIERIQISYTSERFVYYE